VSLTSPTNGVTLSSGTDLVISAAASGSYGAVVGVAFFNGDRPLGRATIPPYSLIWSNLSVGTFTLMAQATDEFGGSTISAPVQVTVVDPSGTTGNSSSYTFTTLAGLAGGR